MLIVPYPRRRRVEGMLRDARVSAEWIAAPTPEAIRASDRKRTLAALLAPVEVDDDDLAMGRELLAQRGADAVAAALVRAYRAALPAPEELIEPAPGAPSTAGQEHHRPGFEDTVWFRINIGRRQNADPRWILPLLCRRRAHHPAGRRRDPHRSRRDAFPDSPRDCGKVRRRRRTQRSGR